MLGLEKLKAKKCIKEYFVKIKFYTNINKKTDIIKNLIINNKLTEQQIFNLLILMPDLVELQPIFKELTYLLQKSQEVQKQQFQQTVQQLKEVQSQVGQP